jgi:hypothetical protein
MTTCKFCCELRKQAFNIFMALLCIVTVGHSLYFLFTGDYLGFVLTQTEISNVVRGAILIILHGVLGVLSIVYWLDKLQHCRYN